MALICIFVTTMWLGISSCVGDLWVFNRKSIQMFAEFSNWVISLLLFHRVTYKFWILILCWLFALRVPSPFSDLCIFTLIMVTLMKRNLMESNLCIFFLSWLTLCLNKKKILCLGPKIFSCVLCVLMFYLSYLSAQWFKQTENNKCEFIKSSV